MWMLALIIACSAGDQVCAYQAPGAVFETQSRCKLVGNIVAGGMMATPIGRYESGKVTVTCRPVDPAADDVLRNVRDDRPAEHLPGPLGSR